ncbi:MAG TPA: FGGY-family carbohydrate kinase [Candidatus Hydrogenedentes bacterium]|nr:FGGY-family carbohydrate kinase [Candidatus Hydrogenedentota bacterium]
MNSSIFLGIDLGTSVLKVCAFDARTGQMLGHASRRILVREVAGGGREQSVAEIDRRFASALEELKTKLGARWRSVAGIGIAAQGGSSIIADRSSGRALTPMILWNDGRTYRYLARLGEQQSASFFQKRLLNEMIPAGLGRLVWLREQCPELFKDTNIHIGAGEYLFYRLTGVWRQDAGNAIQIGSYNVVKAQLDAKLFKTSGLPVSFVAPLRKGHETAELSRGGAKLLGLSKGIPVVGPYIDQEAGYMSALGASAHPLHCSLGTAWVGNFSVPENTASWAPLQLLLPSPVGAGRLIVMPLFAGNRAWDWALEQCVAEDLEHALKEVDGIFKKSLVPSEGLFCLPWFTLPNPVDVTCHGAGCFIGVHSGTQKSDLVRAVAAGLCFEFARIFEHVKTTFMVDALVLCGGASNGWYFRSMLAALFSPLPVLWQRESDFSAARGAVHPLMMHAPGLKTERVKLPRKSDCSVIEQGFARYCAAIKNVFPVPPGGAALVVFPRRENAL